MAKPTKLRTYEARVRCVITKVVTCECAEPPTNDTVWDHTIDEVEIDQHDWEVLSVEEVST